jgi:hypothetical protein
MKPNVGTIDRAIRAVLGLGLLSLILLLDGNARWLGLIGLVPLATAFLGWCPAYLPFGVSTCATRQGH